MQNKDQQLVSLQEESDNLSSALNTAEGRLAEVYGDQERMENEMEGQIKVIEKLRAQVRELEKEKREVQRRYNEQVRPCRLPLQPRNNQGLTRVFRCTDHVL